MVQRVSTILISDLTDKECTDGGETIEFAYRGVSYSIDLTSKEAQKFDDVMFPYLDSARRLGKRRGSRRPATESTVDSKAVRAWAQANGLDVPARGRIPNAVIDQFRAKGN